MTYRVIKYGFLLLAVLAIILIPPPYHWWGMLAATIAVFMELCEEKE